MKLKNKLAIEAAYKYKVEDSEVSMFDYEAGFKAGFLKAREMIIVRIYEVEEVCTRSQLESLGEEESL